VSPSWIVFILRNCKGDSLIVLETRKNDEENDYRETSGYLLEIYFIKQSQSSQDECRVAAFKANKLDALLVGTPAQHQVYDGYEAEVQTQGRYEEDMHIPVQRISCILESWRRLCA